MTTTLTILNIAVFLFSLFLFCRSAPARRRSDRAMATCRRMAPTLTRIRELNIAGIEKVQNATASAIGEFSNLEKRIRTTTKETRRVLDIMRDKIALGVARDVAVPDPAPDPAAIRERYAGLFRSVLEQLSLITERKAEEIDRLEAVRAMLLSPVPGEDPPGKRAGEAARSVGATVSDIREAARVEERLIGSTLSILEEVVLSLVDSFIRINAIVNRTLGESSSLGDEIAAIMVNLQCEDICQEMGELTLSNLTEVFNGLKALGVEFNAPEGATGGEAAAARPKEDDITFFQEPKGTEETTRHHDID